jgi:hypothetical protein
MHERTIALKSKLLPFGSVLGALLFATPAVASPAPNDGDGVVSIFGFEVCVGEQPGVDCELTLPKPPVDQTSATKRNPAPSTPKSPRKLELLGMTMCVGGSAADCDIELPWRSA